MALITQATHTSNIAASADIYRLVVAVERQISVAIATLNIWRQRRADRVALSNMNTHMLEDIGLSYAEAMQESSKPFWRA